MTLDALRFVVLPMSNTGRQPHAAAIAGVAVAALAVAGYIGSASGVPTVRSPLPLATTLPIFWFWVAVDEAPQLRWVIDYAIPMSVGPLLLLAWHPCLTVGADFVPRRSLVGLLVLSALAVAHFVFGWDYGMKYQGKVYVTALLVLNVAALITTWAALLRARRWRKFRSTLIAHALIVAWLVWIAFPWLGELP
jgi:hypothetical protein